MKNLKTIAAVLLILSTLFSFAACKENQELKPVFYQVHIWYEEIPNSDMKSGVTSYKLTDEQKQIAENVCNKVSNYYGIEKKLPKIAMLEDDTMRWLLGATEDTPVYGVYVPADNAIYLSRSFSEKNAVTLAHEYLHYLSNNGSNGGLKYNKDGQEFGKYFSEGVTNFLAYSMYPEEITNVYEFETFFAKQLSICVGEDVLRKAYFSSDSSELREIINSSLSKYYSSENIDGMDLDIFDMMCGQMDEYTMSFIYAETEEMFYAAMSMIDSLEEEILFLGKELGKTELLRPLLKDYMTQLKEVVPYTHLSELYNRFK